MVSILWYYSLCLCKLKDIKSWQLFTLSDTQTCNLCTKMEFIWNGWHVLIQIVYHKVHGQVFVILS